MTVNNYRYTDIATSINYFNTPITQALIGNDRYTYNLLIFEVLWGYIDIKICYMNYLHTYIIYKTEQGVHNNIVRRQV